MYDEYDEEVAAAEAAEEAAIAGRTLEDKDAEIKPFLPKCAPPLLAVPMRRVCGICPLVAFIEPQSLCHVFYGRCIAVGPSH